MISAFDIFKIGIGPSSSHTVGPMNAGKSFITELATRGNLTQTTRIVVDLYGSLSLTGKGHATDVAIIMGLAGNSPQDVDIDAIPGFIQRVTESGRLPVAGSSLRRPMALAGLFRRFWPITTSFAARSMPTRLPAICWLRRLSVHCIR